MKWGSFTNILNRLARHKKVVLCVVLALLVLGGSFFVFVRHRKNKKRSPNQIVIISRETIPADSVPGRKRTSDLKLDYENHFGTVMKFWLYDFSKNNGEKKKLLDEHFFPFKQTNPQYASADNLWRNLFEFNNGKRFFVNNTDKGIMFFEILYDPIKEKVFIGNIQQIGEILPKTYIVGISPDQKFFVDSLCNLIRIEPDEKSNHKLDSRYSHLVNKSDFTSIRSICITDENRLIIQTAENNENCLSYFSNPDNGKARTLKFGYDPYQYYDQYEFYPTDINQNRDKIAFMSKHYGEEEKTADGTSERKKAQWLCVWDLKSDKVQKVYPLEDNMPLTPGSLLWCPDRSRNVIAVCESGGVMIINVASGKKIQEIHADSAIIRWSPDGSKLGVMASDGVLSSYDMNTCQLLKVDENPDNFNFFWVE
jgi:WD40 repeat protein